MMSEPKEWKKSQNNIGAENCIKVGSHRSHKNFFFFFETSHSSLQTLKYATNACKVSSLSSSHSLPFFFLLIRGNVVWCSTFEMTLPSSQKCVYTCNYVHAKKKFLFQLQNINFPLIVRSAYGVVYLLLLCCFLGGFEWEKGS